MSEVIDAYLRRLGLDAEPPSVDALFRIHRAQVERVPYETTWIPLGERWDIDTKAAVERIRGVDSDYILRSLLHRRLIVELGRASAPGRPILYGTGFDFLERFGITSLDELPVLDADIAGRLVD